MGKEERSYLQDNGSDVYMICRITFLSALNEEMKSKDLLVNIMNIQS